MFSENFIKKQFNKLKQAKTGFLIFFKNPNYIEIQFSINLNVMYDFFGPGQYSEVLLNFFNLNCWPYLCE